VLATEVTTTETGIGPKDASWACADRRPWAEAVIVVLPTRYVEVKLATANSWPALMMTDLVTVPTAVLEEVIVTLVSRLAMSGRIPFESTMPTAMELYLPPSARTGFGAVKSVSSAGFPVAPKLVILSNAEERPCADAVIVDVPFSVVDKKMPTALIWPVAIVRMGVETNATVRFEDVSVTAMGEDARAGFPEGSASQTTTLPLVERSTLVGSAVTFNEYGGDPTTPREVVPALNPEALAVITA
jgi:hypothetical protein